ncbi:hypothetical protein CEP53_013649 [Fusarium sp. AF-6]|nr:hypothetical protein CEP53_013649 [Fusarium sp. AF-6]
MVGIDRVSQRTSIDVLIAITSISRTVPVWPRAWSLKNTKQNAILGTTAPVPPYKLQRPKYSNHALASSFDRTLPDSKFDYDHPILQDFKEKVGDCNSDTSPPTKSWKRNRDIETTSFVWPIEEFQGTGNKGVISPAKNRTKSEDKKTSKGISCER